MNAPHRQHGSIIIYAMLTMAAMLAIGLTLTGIFLGKLRRAVDTRSSAAAIYIADSAVEKCLLEARTGVDIPALEFIEQGAYEIIGADDNGEPEVDITDRCSTLDTGRFRFRATGIYRGVRRTLEITQ